MTSVPIYTIYRATNIITGKSYIGYTAQSLPKRINQHKHSYSTSNTKFYNSIRKHGWDIFEWHIIYQSTDGDYTLRVMESHFITEFDSINNGYNSTTGGDYTIITNEVREKLAKASRNRIFKTESKLKISNTKSKYYTVTDPNGTVYQVHGLIQFCKDNNLNIRRLYEMANNTRIDYKGWRCSHTTNT